MRCKLYFLMILVILLTLLLSAVVLELNGTRVAEVRGTVVPGVYKITGNGAATTLNAVSGSPFASGGLTTQILALDSLHYPEKV